MNLKTFFIPTLFKNRVFLIIAFLGISTLAINLFVNIILQQRFIAQGIKKAANSQFTIVRAPLLEAILTDDLFRQLKIAQSVVDADEAINNVYVLNNKFNYLTDAKILKALPFKINPETLNSSFRVNNLGYEIYDINLNSGTIGYLLLEIDYDAIQISTFNQLQSIFWINLFIIIIGLLIGLKLSRLLTTPLEKLSREMDQTGIRQLPLNLSLPKYASREIIQLHESLQALSQRLKNAVDELADKERIIAHSEKLASIGTMAAGLAHELKNPIMTIDLLTTKLQRGLRETKHIDDLDVVRLESKRLVFRINEFLEFSRKVKVKLEKITIKELKLSLERFIKESIGEKISFETAENNFTEHLLVDKEKIQQVVLNIVNNSIEANAEKLKFFYVNGFKYHRFIFVDNGTGFSESDQEMAFQPFFTTKKKGTGLGLSICEMIMDAMKGGIFLESGREQGAKVILTLPKQNR